MKGLESTVARKRYGEGSSRHRGNFLQTVRERRINVSLPAWKGFGNFCRQFYVMWIRHRTDAQSLNLKDLESAVARESYEEGSIRHRGNFLQSVRERRIQNVSLPARKVFLIFCGQFYVMWIGHRTDAQKLRTPT